MIRFPQTIPIPRSHYGKRGIFSREDMAELLRSLTPNPFACWECGCGCPACFLYVRDARALWVLSQLGYENLPMSAFGIETRDELEGCISAWGLDPVMAVALTAAFDSLGNSGAVS